MVTLPTRIHNEIYVIGDLISKDLCELCKRDIDIKRNSIYILGIYPSNFPNAQLEVHDLYNKINWNNIPDRHKHYYRYKGIRVLCTHYPKGEINGFTQEQKTIEILKCSWHLFMQCKKYCKNKKWTLRDLPHDANKAEKILCAEKQLYNLN